VILRVALVVLLTLGGLAAPATTDAQQPKGKVWRVGFLSGTARPPDGLPPRALRDALRDLGYVEPQNVAYVGRWAEAQNGRMPGLAAELVGAGVDVIVTTGWPATTAARQASTSIPIVMSQVGDADSLGFIESFARPGGNITGVTDQSAELSAKRLEILTEAIPKARRVAVIWNADDRGMTLRYQNVEKAAQALRVAVQPLGVRAPDDFDAAFAAMAQQRPDALLMVTDGLTNLNRKRVIDFAALHKIPAMYEFSFLVQDGGLMSYGPSQEENYRLAAGYVDRLFKGAAPSTLPVARPTRYYLAINQKTARSLGLTLPPSILVRADQVIE
jgi:putative ABC transport system substrate-binding protein